MKSNTASEFRKMEEDIKTNHVGGLVQLDNYTGSDLNLTGWTITSVVDDVLLVEYADVTTDGEGVYRGDIIVPLNMTEHVWRIGKVMISGAKCTIKPGQFIMFPSDKGLQARNVNGRKKVVFLNQDRIFGVVEKNTN